MRKLQTYRFLFYWVHVLFAMGVPCLLIAQKYDVFKSVTNAPTSLKLAGGGMMIAIVVFFFFHGQINEMISNMEESPIKTTVIQIKRCMPILLLYLMLSFAEVHMANFKFIVLWSFISNLIGSVFNVWHIKFKVRVKDLRLENKIAKVVKQ